MASQGIFSRLIKMGFRFLKGAKDVFERLAERSQHLHNTSEAAGYRERNVQMEQHNGYLDHRTQPLNRFYNTLETICFDPRAARARESYLTAMRVP